MYFLLEKEIEIKESKLFKSTVFVTWEDFNNQLLIFWGNELINKYCSILISNKFPKISNFKNKLIEVQKDCSVENKNEPISNLIDHLEEFIKQNFPKEYIQIDTNSVNVYTNLYHHLWRINFDDISKYIPVKKFDLLKEWHHKLLQNKINAIGISSLMFDENSKAKAESEFILEMIDKVNGKIEFSRKWYKSIYGNGTDGTSLTKYPIKELKTYLEWLENLKIHSATNHFETEIKNPAIVFERVLPKSEELRKKLNQYGFFNIESLKGLSEESGNKLLDFLVENDTPYQIAMFNHIGFIKYLNTKFAESKEELYKKLAGILNTTDRTIKGNILVLNPYSKESRDRYTSCEYIKQVNIDFDNLK